MVAMGDEYHERFTVDLRDDDEAGFLTSVRRDSFVNRPLGDEAFVTDLEKRFQMRLTSGKAGIPFKAEKRDD